MGAPHQTRGQQGGRVGGPDAELTIARAEALGLLEAAMGGPVARGKAGVHVNHVDRKGTLQRLAKLPTMTPRERLKIHDRDVWEAIDVITRHLGDRFEAVKVKAHVDRHHKKPSLHEKGNEYADAKADQSIREELTVEVRAAAKVRIDKLRPFRWRLHHLEGPEITRGLKTAIKEGCSRAAGKADDRERLKAGRQVRYRLDSRLMTMATSKARKALAGPCVEALGEGGADAPEEWLHARAGGRGGGLLYRQAQLCKFLHGRLVTQHIKEERARGGNEQCGVCSDWVRADNDHMLFQCRGREIVQARRQWIGRVQQAWASAALPKRFKEEARARWELEETGGDGGVHHPRK